MKQLLLPAPLLAQLEQARREHREAIAAANVRLTATEDAIYAQLARIAEGGATS